jgi:hypothetical protein
MLLKHLFPELFHALETPGGPCELVVELRPPGFPHLHDRDGGCLEGLFHSRELHGRRERVSRGKTGKHFVESGAHVLPADDHRGPPGLSLVPGAVLQHHQITGASGPLHGIIGTKRFTISSRASSSAFSVELRHGHLDARVIPGLGSLEKGIRHGVVVVPTLGGQNRLELRLRVRQNPVVLVEEHVGQLSMGLFSHLRKDEVSEPAVENRGGNLALSESGDGYVLLYLPSNLFEKGVYPLGIHVEADVFLPDSSVSIL